MNERSHVFGSWLLGAKSMSLAEVASFALSVAIVHHRVFVDTGQDFRIHAVASRIVVEQEIGV